ncbi:MAG: AAA family ATPase [Solibacillus sp.]|uniref:AAA family ATPase n=1 Tax=Solibacillus sp. TaxID=1909654 RepID=UPI00331615FB
MFFLQMSGFPGAGKSTLSREIAKRKIVVIIDHDVTKSSLMKSFQNENDPQLNIGKVAYELDFGLVEHHLSLGQNVILDSPCLYEEIITKGTALAKKYHADYKYIDCALNDFKLTNSRLSGRQAMVSQIKEVLEENNYIHTLNHTKYPEEYRYITVDTKQPIDGYLDVVMAYLEED